MAITQLLKSFDFCTYFLWKRPKSRQKTIGNQTIFRLCRKDGCHSLWNPLFLLTSCHQKMSKRFAEFFLILKTVFLDRIETERLSNEFFQTNKTIKTLFSGRGCHKAATMHFFKSHSPGCLFHFHHCITCFVISAPFSVF